MFLTKKSNGIYYIYYQNREGKRSSISTKSKFKVEANYFLANFRKQYFKELSNPVITITLKQFRWNFLKYSESVHTVKTNKVYKTTFKFLLEHFGEIELDKITTKGIQDFLIKRSNESSIYAARRDHINISSMFNKAVLDGHLLENPCKGIKRFKLPERQPAFYTKETFKQLIESVDNENIKELIIFDVNTGLRQAEICSLQWSQINEEKKILTLDNSIHITKSKRIRSIPLNNDALTIINNMRMKRINDFVFNYNNEPINPDKLSVKFKTYVRKAKLDDRLNFHSLRHTFASWLVQKGVSIFVVSKLLGHQDVQTTMIYSHLTTEDLKSATDRLNNIS